LATLALLLLAGAASAQTACVRCTGPDATYSCTATSEERIADAALGLFCVSRIAGEHHHASCGVERGRSDCGGLPVSYVYDQGAVPGAPLAAEPQAAEAPGNGEPRTLDELTHGSVTASAKAVQKAGENLGTTAANAGKATVNAIKDAGKTVGDATKKTLKCLGSALNDC
jgi:hypothetical protein